MKTQELEQVIREYFRNIYHKEYIGQIKIEKLDPIGYCVKLGMATPDQPITICAALEDKAFLKFMRQEIKDRRFNCIYFGELKRVYPTSCQPINSACSCHDKE